MYISSKPSTTLTTAHRSFIIELLFPYFVVSRHHGDVIIFKFEMPFFSEKASKITEKKPTVGGTLNLFMLLAIIGGVVLLITCLVGGLCIYLQGQKIKRKKRAARERKCKEKELEMTTLQSERLINHYSAGNEK